VNFQQRTQTLLKIKNFLFFTRQGSIKHKLVYSYNITAGSFRHCTYTKLTNDEY